MDLDTSTSDSYLAYDQVGVLKRRNVQEDLVNGSLLSSRGFSAGLTCLESLRTCVNTAQALRTCLFGAAALPTTLYLGILGCFGNYAKRFIRPCMKPPFSQRFLNKVELPSERMTA